MSADIFKTSNGERVIVQKPNLPIIAAGISWVIKHVTSGELSAVFSTLTTALLMYWALLELFWGVNLYRRILGAVVAVMSLNSLYS